MLRGEIKDLRSAIAAILVLGAIGAIVLPLFDVEESKTPATARVEPAPDAADGGAGRQALATSPGGYRILRASWETDSAEETEEDGSGWAALTDEDVPEEVRRIREEAGKRWRNLDIAVSPR